MILYPAIDLRLGKCVRLFQGDFSQSISYDDDPVKISRLYAKQGATHLHVVDLDGAKQGSLQQIELIANIQKKSGLIIQIGGGIRNYQDIELLFKYNISRVVLGSVAVKNPKLVQEWLNEYGPDKIVLAFDIRMTNNIPLVAEQGWQVSSQKTLWELLDIYSKYSLKHVLCTDIQLDGTLTGVNVDLYQRCRQRYPEIQFQASGGVSCLEDLKTLKQMSLSGVIIGKALYEKKFSLKQALDVINLC